MTPLSSFPWNLCLYVGAVYTTTAIYQGFSTVYFRSTGLSASSVGFLVSLMPLIAMFAQPLWGVVGDRMKLKNTLLRILIAGSAAVVLLYPMGDTMLKLGMLICAFACFQTAILPLGDTIVLESLDKLKRPFGPVRYAGTVVFALTSLVAGFALSGHPERLPYLSALVFALVFAATFALPNVPGHNRAAQKASPFALFKDREFVLLMLFMLLLQTTFGFYYTYYPMLMNGLPGGSSILLGASLFVSAMSETPFLLTGDKLFKRFGAGRLLCIAAGAMTLRWVLMATSTAAWNVLFAQVLHGLGFIVITFCGAKYVSITVPQELRASGQMLLGMVTFGISRVIGNLFGATIVANMGEGIPAIKAGFLCCATLTAIAAVAFGLRYFRMKPINGE